MGINHFKKGNKKNDLYKIIIVIEQALKPFVIYTNIKNVKENHLSKSSIKKKAVYHSGFITTFA